MYGDSVPNGPTYETEQVKTRGIWRSFLEIGISIPYPFVIAASIAAAIYSFASDLTPLFILGLIILGAGVWGLTSYLAYASIFKTFYKHGLRAAPFIFVILASILLVSQAAYKEISVMFVNAQLPLLFNTAMASIVLFVYSIVASALLLPIWGNQKINGLVKALSALLLIAISAFLCVYIVYLP